MVQYKCSLPQRGLAVICLSSVVRELYSSTVPVLLSVSTAVIGSACLPIPKVSRNLCARRRKTAAEPASSGNWRAHDWCADNSPSGDHHRQQ